MSFSQPDAHSCWDETVCHSAGSTPRGGKASGSRKLAAMARPFCPSERQKAWVSRVLRIDLQTANSKAGKKPSMTEKKEKEKKKVAPI